MKHQKGPRPPNVEDGTMGYAGQMPSRHHEDECKRVVEATAPTSGLLPTGISLPREFIEGLYAKLEDNPQRQEEARAGATAAPVESGGRTKERGPPVCT